MPKYSQKVTFFRTFHIEAKDAAEATSMLGWAVHDVMFTSDLQCEGWNPFEDEEPEPEEDTDEV